jgi:hypothetical protein
MSTAQPSKTPGVRPGAPKSAQQTQTQASDYKNKGVNPNKPRGMGC